MAFTLIQAHGMVMILSWIVFGSTGVLFARYGRPLRLGRRRQLLGKALWFQIHRFFLSLSSLLTILGFLLILSRAGGQWVNPHSDKRLFAHSILGGTMVCCIIVQIWLALYRCHPQSRFRFIFDWSHRTIGLLVFILSIPTIFLPIAFFSRSRIDLYIIISVWAGWIVIVILIFEKIEFQQRAAAPSVVTNTCREEINQNTTGARPDVEAGTNLNGGNPRLNLMKLILLVIHILISITLSISLIVRLTM
jgi:hypothetical protein